MPSSQHDRMPQRGDDRTEDDREPGLPPDEQALRLAATQRWLVDELRDECSDIGIGVRGFDLEGFVRGVWVFAREARRLGAPPERMLVLLKQCLADHTLSAADRGQYQLHVDRAVTAGVRAYFDTTGGPVPGGADDAARAG